jgi:hypothetical protein
MRYRALCLAVSLWTAGPLTVTHAASPHYVFPSQDLTSPEWEHCLQRQAQSLAVHPALLRAVIYTESRNHPWAIAWTDRFGTRHSIFPKTLAEAHQLLTALQRRRQTADVGLGQINSNNWAALRHALHLQPHELLEPCRNLAAAGFILREQLSRHGYRWQALAGYNGSVGSTKYIVLVHANLCRQTPDLCRQTSGSPQHPDPDDPLPGQPLLLASMESLFPPPAPVASAVEEREMVPTTIIQKEMPMTWIEILAQSLPTAMTMMTLSLHILLPFAIFTGLVVLLAYGTLIILWAIGLVKEGVRTLLLDRRPAFPVPIPAFARTTPPTPSVSRRLAA